MRTLITSCASSGVAAATTRSRDVSHGGPCRAPDTIAVGYPRTRAYSRSHGVRGPRPCLSCPRFSPASSAMCGRSRQTADHATTVRRAVSLTVSETGSDTPGPLVEGGGHRRSEPGTGWISRRRTGSILARSPRLLHRLHRMTLRSVDPRWISRADRTGRRLWVVEAGARAGHGDSSMLRHTPALCPRGDAGRLHPKLQVADMHVQQMGDTQPRNAVGIDGGPGL